MDIQNFIESGILEEYCMGWLDSKQQAYVVQMAQLYPQVKEELERVELALEGLAKLNAVDIITPRLKDKILDSLDPISQNHLDLDHLPVIDKHTDHQVWLNSVLHLIAAEPEQDIIFEPLRQDDKITQTLVVSKVNVPEETHTDILETLLILQGYCECTIGEDVFKAGPGDVIEIPLNIPHDVKMLSPFVAAIVQHQMV